MHTDATRRERGAAERSQRMSALVPLGVGNADAAGHHERVDRTAAAASVLSATIRTPLQLPNVVSDATISTL